MGQGSMAHAAKILAGKYQGDYALGNVLSAIKDGYGHKTFTTEKGWEEGFLGALTSLIPFGGKRTGILAPFQSSKEMEQNTDALINVINNNQDFANKFTELYNNANFHYNTYKASEDPDIRNNEYKQYKNNEADLINYISTAVNLGRVDIIKEKI